MGTDCGDPMKGAVFFLLFMVAATFAVLNLAIATILNSFTWIYTLEPSEVTGDLNVSKNELEHFQAIWCRFDVQGEAAIPLSSLQTLLAISRRNIDKMFLTGDVNQRDEKIYRDYSSWGTGENGADVNEVEEENHENFNSLVEWLTKLEEHKEVYKKIEDSGVDVSAGENSDVFTEDIERYNHTGNIKLFTREGDVKKLHAVEFESLVSILVADPLGLSDHDIFVVNDYRHPYTAVIPGYLPSSISSDGLHVLLPGDEIKEELLPDEGSLEMEVLVDNPIQNSSPSPEAKEVQVQNITLSDKLDDDEGITQSNPLSDKLDDEGIPPMENNPLNSSDDEDITPYNVWWQEHKDAIQELFNRYDLDDTGFLNSPQELKYCTKNLLKTLQEGWFNVPDDVVQEALDKKNPVFEDGRLLDQIDFSEWFFNSFVVPRQVQDEVNRVLV